MEQKKLKIALNLPLRSLVLKVTKVITLKKHPNRSINIDFGTIKLKNSIKPAPTKLSAKGNHSQSNSRSITLKKHPNPSINKDFGTIKLKNSIKPAHTNLFAKGNHR